MQYRSQSRANRLQNWHMAYSVKGPAHRLPGGCSAWPGGRFAFEGRPYGEDHTDHQQQWLFVLVAAQLAADEFSGLEFEEVITAPQKDDASARPVLLLSSSILVPCLRHDGATVWDTLAIGGIPQCGVMPDAGLLPADRVQRAHCRSICGEIHSGFTTLRASLPVNLKGHFPGFKIWSRAQADIDRVCVIWRECLPNAAGRSCLASAPWRMQCTPPSSPAS